MKTALERATQRIERYRRRNPDAVRLARLASLAVRVEPYLLRRLRLELLSEADVGAEADLWFSPLVESRGVNAVVLDHHVVDVLREDLATDRGLFEQAKNITEEAHGHAPPSIRLEENLNALALLNEGDVVAAIDETLHPALRALTKGGDRAREIAHWAMRALPRFHPTVRQSGSAVSLLLASSLLLGCRLLRETPDANVELRNVAWVLPADALSERVSLGVALIERGIRFLEAGSGSPAIDLPLTNPLLVGLAWMHNGERMEMLVEAEPGRTLDLEADVSEITIRTLVGDEYLLERAGGAAKAVDDAEQEKTCLVIQPFGKKIDHRTARTLDFDKTHGQIRGAAAYNGLKSFWSDGTKPDVFERLLNADVVVADLSTSNPRVFYELGIRHALRPFTTIMIAEAEFQFPYDINMFRIIRYENLGKVEGMEALLTEVIQKRLSQQAFDSPVYEFIPEMSPPTVSGETPRSDSETDEAQMEKCFVIQGWGTKTDYRSGRTIDLHQTYEHIIKTAVEEAGLECIRMNEVDHSGVVGKPAFEWLLNADLVVADLSTAAPETFYELGIRHALRPRTTIIMAEKEVQYVFDPILGLRIHSYEHLGKGIDRKEVERMRAELKGAIRRQLSEPIVDSPVYRFMPDLKPPEHHQPNM